MNGAIKDLYATATMSNSATINIYSKASMTRTPMARLPWMIRIRF